MPATEMASGARPLCDHSRDISVAPASQYPSDSTKLRVPIGPQRPRSELNPRQGNCCPLSAALQQIGAKRAIWAHSATEVRRRPSFL